MNKTGTQRIETHRLVLRPFDVDDAEDAIYGRDLTDVIDILKEMLRETEEAERNR